MYARQFEDLEIWQLSISLYQDFAKIFYQPNFRNYSFQDQIMRATLSISNNIAEGFERSNRNEFRRFLLFAKGSCGEVRSMLFLAKNLGYISEELCENFIKICREIAVKITKFIQSLQKH